jgi:hypothetical protein
MIRRSYLAIAATAALCTPAAALAAGHQSAGHESASVNCGGSGVNSLYCIPQQSVFAFTHTASAPHCSLKVGFTVEPKIQGLKGHVHLGLKGTSHQDRSVSRVAHPLVSGGAFTYKFTNLRAGAYALSGWYEGDSTRQASTHQSEHVTLHCG